MSNRQWPLGPSIVATIVLVTLLVSSATACESKSCTMMGCSNVASGAFDVPLTLTELDGTRLELCRNGICTTARIGPSPFRVGQPLDCQTVNAMAGGGSVGCQKFDETSDGTRILVAFDPTFGKDLADGDQFTLRLMDASASTPLASRSGTVARYETFQPNGAECDGDYFCRSGTF